MPKVWNKNDPNVPKDAVYIGRGSPFGNEFRIGVHGSRSDVCRLNAEKVENNPEFKALIKRELAGKDLVCFCKPKQCHGDYYLEVANGYDLFDEPSF